MATIDSDNGCRITNDARALRPPCQPVTELDQHCGTAMSQQPVRTCQVLLQRLSDLKTAYTGSTDGLPQYEAVMSSYDDLRALPRPMPRATVKKIVQEQQVRFINLFVIAPAADSLCLAYLPRVEATLPRSSRPCPYLLHAQHMIACCTCQYSPRMFHQAVLHLHRLSQAASPGTRSSGVQLESCLIPDSHQRHFDYELVEML